MSSLGALIVIGTLGASLAGAGPAPPASCAQEPALELRVNRAIALAVDYLRRQQRADGTFPGHEQRHPGGATALGALALAKAGVRRDDASLARALEALRDVELASTYSASVHLLLCEALPDRDERLAAARRSLAFLVEHQVRGVWAYPWDHLCGSNTQFALMGLRAARRLGLEVPESTLAEAAEGLWLFQDRSGGFVYAEGGKPYCGMTAAALSGLAVLEEIGGESRAVRVALDRRAKQRRAAQSWLEQHFDPTRNAYANGSWTPFWHYAYMWAIERWCGLTGRAEVAGRDWYAEGARWLLDTQAPDGSWPSDDHPFENTCLVLLFLRRATVSDSGELAAIYETIDRERAAAERPPARPGAQARRLTDWWLAGPWQDGEDASLLVQPPFDPASVRPRERAKLERRPWKRVSLKPDGWTDLDEIGERPGDRQLWCLATSLSWSPPEGVGGVEAWLWLDLEDGWSVWLDGERMSLERRVGSAINGDVRIPLDLSPGQHPLVVLVEDVGGAAAFGARLTDAGNGPPPEGLR